MTTKIEFNNVNEIVLDKILDKHKTKLSQEDLLIIRNQLFNAFNHKTGNLTKQELLINQAMYILTEQRYFKPIRKIKISAGDSKTALKVTF